MITRVLADIGALGTAVGVVFAGVQLWINRRQARTQFEDGLTSVYRDLIADLPTKAFFNLELPDDEIRAHLQSFYRYFDLCNEQAFLSMKRRVTGPTWDQWRDGIEGNMARPAFRAAWYEEIAPYVGLDFQEFKTVLERSEMAKKTVFVSDLTGKEINDQRDAASVTITYGDARKGIVRLDVLASEVIDMASKGTQQKRRGRRPKSELT